MSPETGELRPPAADGAPGATTCPAPSIADGADTAALLEVSDERDTQERRLLAAELRAYRDGYRDGRADERRDADEAWQRIPGLQVTGEPAHAALEVLRWGPGGRDRFGDPRPGDYTPREAA